MKFIKSLAILSCLTLGSACVPEPLTGDAPPASDMGGGSADMIAPVTDMGGGGMDMPTGGGMDMMVTPTDQGGDIPATGGNPFTTSDNAAVMAGGILYGPDADGGRGCTGCHGVDGNGPTVTTPMTMLIMKDDATLYKSVDEGISFMPGYGANSKTGVPSSKEAMTDTEIWQVITYLQATFGS